MDYAQEQHDRLVQMIADQDNLDQLMKQKMAPSRIECDVLIIGDRSKFTYDSLGVRIDSFVKLEIGEGLHIGAGVHIASFAHVGIGGGEVIIEDFAAVASGSRIISGSNQIDALSMSASAPKEIQRVKRSVTKLSKYSCTLVNSSVLPGVTLGEGAVLAAGAVATQDIPAWEIWAGVPAKLLVRRETK